MDEKLHIHGTATTNVQEPDEHFHKHYIKIVFSGLEPIYLTCKLGRAIGSICSGVLRRVELEEQGVDHMTMDQDKLYPLLTERLATWEKHGDTALVKELKLLFESEHRANAAMREVLRSHGVPL